jgi:hypothetical protein
MNARTEIVHGGPGKDGPELVDVFGYGQVRIRSEIGGGLGGQLKIAQHKFFQIKIRMALFSFVGFQDEPGVQHRDAIGEGFGVGEDGF